MKRFLIWLGIFLLLLGLVVLVERGVIRWQPLTMLVAVLVAPFRLLLGFFEDRQQDIRAEHEKLRQEEFAFQQQLETDVAQRSERIGELRQEVATLDDRLADLRRRRAAVSGEIDQMSTEELADLGARVFG